MFEVSEQAMKIRAATLRQNSSALLRVDLRAARDYPTVQNKE
jgi:hypothetical protein